MIRIESKRLYIRQMMDGDFELISLIWLERSPTLFDGDKEFQEKLLRELWESNQGPNTLTGLVFLQNGDRFCGRVNMQKTDEEVPELGIDLLGEYQNQGYGSEAITAFANWYGESHHVSEIKVRIMAVNTRLTVEQASQRQILQAQVLQDLEPLANQLHIFLRRAHIRSHQLQQGVFLSIVTQPVALPYWLPPCSGQRMVTLSRNCTWVVGLSCSKWKKT